MPSCMSRTRDTAKHFIQPSKVVEMGYIEDVSIRDNRVHIVMKMPHCGQPKHWFIRNTFESDCCSFPALLKLR